MKKNGVFILTASIVLFPFSIYGILSMNIPLAPILLFFSTFTFFFLVSISITNCREALAACSSAFHKPLMHEPVFIARLFLSMSWIARNCGIVALEEFMTNKEYNNTLYHMGKNMIVNCMSPEFIKDTLENIIHDEKKLEDINIQYLRQMGRIFCFTSVFSGCIGIIVYVLRWLNTTDVPVFDLGIILAMTIVSLMLGILLYVLIPYKLENDTRRFGQIQKQMIQGLISLQEGDAYDTMLSKQYLFLSIKEKYMLYEEPLFTEVKGLNQDGSYDTAVTNIRSAMEQFGIC